ncbi:MAG: hypothetical protein IPH31_02350 [Lewinellaceae bacterium]|nr:hypothetical protein [Lewinellaceae bacterium]
MKHLVLSLTALLFTVSTLHAQSKKELTAMLDRDLELYKRYTLTLNLDSSLQFMPPKMFEVVHRDSLRESLVQSMDNELLSIQMTSFDFVSKSKIKIKKAGQYHWAVVPYTGSMRLTLKGEESFRAIVIPVLKSQFGSKNVQMENDSTMSIKLVNKEFIAFKDPALPIWSLIEDKRSGKGREAEYQKMLFETILPEEVLKAVDKK